jgi:predicted dehydrogenase
MVGFNRRFSPMVERMRDFIAASGEAPVITVRVNAGPATKNHWTMDPAQGGGRILGEACHFVDLLTFLAGSLPVRVSASPADFAGGNGEENFAAAMEFAGGGTGSLVYTAAGDRSFGKERVEVFCGGRVAVLDDFRLLEIWRDGNRRSWHSRLRQDKGHRAVWAAFVKAVLGGGPAPVPPEELFAITRATFALQRAVRERAMIEIV